MRAGSLSGMQTTDLNKDTVLCMSLSGRPSNLGTRFHNFLYAEFGLNYVYKAFTTNDIVAAVGGIRALGIRGCAISMPFKEAVIPLVDEMDESASAIDSVNTLVNTDGRLRAYNTDYSAVFDLLSEQGLDTAAPVAVCGSGGMAKAVVAAVRASGFSDGTVVARNSSSGPALADQYGFEWRPEIGDLQPGIIINATPIGMAGGPDADALPVPEDVVAGASFVMDVVAVPAQTPLIQAARSRGIPVVIGTQVVADQAAAQFELYTGIRLTPDQVARASEFSRR